MNDIEKTMTELKRAAVTVSIHEIEAIGNKARRLQLKSRLTKNSGLGEKVRDLRRCLKYYECV